MILHALAWNLFATIPSNFLGGQLIQRRRGTHVYLCVRVRGLFACVPVHLCVCVSMYGFVRPCAADSMSVGLCLGACACACACARVYACAYVSAYLWTCKTDTHTDIQIDFVRAHTHTHSTMHLPAHET